MAAPTTVEPGSRSWSQFGNASVGLLSSMTPMVVLNSNSKLAHASYNDPYALRAGTDTNGATIRAFPVPKGAPYLFLSHAWVVGVGSHPTTLPVVRAYGLAGFLGKELEQWREGSLAGGFAEESEAWNLLGNDNTGLYDLPLGTVGLADMVHHGAHYSCKPEVVHCSGCDLVMVAIRDAAVGPDYGCIIGSFRK